MLHRLIQIGAMAACLAAAGCSVVPRGAAFQAEVLEAGALAGDEAPNFAVAPVTQENLALYESWPKIGEPHYGWINRVEQPATRVITPGDELTITVWNTEENGLLTGPGQRFVKLDKLQVSPSGRIFLPYIGEQRVEGMSPERAREVIEEKYISVTPSAQVQVALAEGRQSTVSLVSGVAAPGTYPLIDQDVTILSILSEAGGAATSLENPQVRLHRNGRVYGVALSRIFDNPRLNTTLQGGDRIIIEGDDRYFLSLGAAGSESLFPFPRDGLHALEALSVMGGVSDSRADPQGILILREYPKSAVGPGGPTHERVVFTIDLTSADGLFSAGEFHIRSGDLVYATESPVTTAQTIFGILGSAVGLSRQITR